MSEGQSGGHPAIHRALLIEPDAAYRAAMAECLRLSGCVSELVGSPEMALSGLDYQKVELIVWGRNVSDVGNGTEKILDLRTRVEGPLILVDGSPEAAQLAVALKAEHWLPKPFVPSALVEAIRSVLMTS
jgi:DNA-binding response OmpR family regulator